MGNKSLQQLGQQILTRQGLTENYEPPSAILFSCLHCHPSGFQLGFMLLRILGTQFRQLFQVRLQLRDASLTLLHRLFVVMETGLQSFVSLGPFLNLVYFLLHLGHKIIVLLNFFIKGLLHRLCKQKVRHKNKRKKDGSLETQELLPLSSACCFFSLFCSSRSASYALLVATPSSCNFTKADPSLHASYEDKRIPKS